MTRSTEFPLNCYDYEVRRFEDRLDAGAALGAKLAPSLASRVGGVVVLGIPRGGVPVAFEVAVALASPLDVVIVRKIGVPTQRELAMGAIGEAGATVVEVDVVRSLNVSDEQFADVLARERSELDRRVRLYRGASEQSDIKGRTVVIVDDGIATGSSVRAACQVARLRGASRLVVATPVSSVEAATRLQREVDAFVSLITVEGPFAVGNWYQHFEQTSDEQVLNYLELSAARW
ncbi:MAG TPA: phosphoribosyltransferase family protein [Acidimicrobiales bacterium]|nr:phosphoribosyltransferase family protein [Acidimicrobiales bacterium]